MQLIPRRLRQKTSAVTDRINFNGHLLNIGLTDSSLCRAFLGTEEKVAHVLLECDKVAVYRATHPAPIREVFGNFNALGDFLEELGWLEQP